MSPDRIFNGYDVVRVLGLPFITSKDHGFALSWFPVGASKPMTHVFDKRSGSALHKDRSNENITHGTWEAAVAAAGRRFSSGPNWVPLRGERGAGYWLPASAVDKALKMDLRWTKEGERGSPVKFGEPGHPCTAITGDWGGNTCGRPAKETFEGREAPAFSIPNPSRGVSDGKAHLCGLHASAQRRVLANDAAREAESAARQERWDREAANTARCQEVLGKIRPLLAELGIHPQTLAVGHASGGPDGQRVGILLPAEAAELLTSKAVELEQLLSDLDLSGGFADNAPQLGGTR